MLLKIESIEEFKSCVETAINNETSPQVFLGYNSPDTLRDPQINLTMVLATSIFTAFFSCTVPYNDLNDHIEEITNLLDSESISYYKFDSLNFNKETQMFYTAKNKAQIFFFD